MLRFRKSIRIAKGVRVNIGKKGVSSVSVGGRGATLNVGKKGAKATVGMPGTGISYEQNLSGRRGSKQQFYTEQGLPEDSVTRKQSHLEQKLLSHDCPVGFYFGIALFLCPLLFYWLLLFRKGYSTFARIMWGCWLVVWFTLFVVR